MFGFGTPGPRLPISSRRSLDARLWAGRRRAAFSHPREGGDPGDVGYDGTSTFPHTYPREGGDPGEAAYDGTWTFPHTSSPRRRGPRGSSVRRDVDLPTHVIPAKAGIQGKQRTTRRSFELVVQV